MRAHPGSQAAHVVIADAQEVELARQLVQVVAVAAHAALRAGDDGRGVGNRRGNGLTGMRERVESLDGVLSIDGGKGIGTQLTISVPLTVAVEQPA